MLKNINGANARHILNHCLSEEKLFTDYHTVSSFPFSKIFSGPEEIEALLNRAEKELRFIFGNNIGTLYFEDVNYPSRLLNCEDCPVMLYRLGSTNLESRHVVSIVGTRHATPYGIDITNRIVRELSEKLEDLVIISGLAYGIDVAAHKAALDCGVPTVAVLANPLNTIYPADHRGVAVKILQNGGALLTEYSTSHETHKVNFLARNRIIAGISDVTIIVESDVRGGSLATARMALEYNRGVYAVPGRITDKYAGGTLNLIANNAARIYLSAEQIIEDMCWETKKGAGEQLKLSVEMSPDEKTIHDFLIANPGSRHQDISVATSMSHSTLKDILFTLEMKDLVISMPGGRYSAL